ncbi:hypothetical protein [Prosthecobacter sp.]|uniref:hypothetical protein n=1 Tax=Prosthecobacter sp. TaxID=1965333 RepID=UPI00390479D2
MITSSSNENAARQIELREAELQAAFLLKNITNILNVQTGLNSRKRYGNYSNAEESIKIDLISLTLRFFES